jgi:phytoene desaturase
MRKRRAVVVGAGLGGLAAAAHLVERDFDVVVVERDATPGGRAGRLELGAYTFDTGPTVITMPDILRRTFAAVDVELDKVVDLVALDPVYRATFADGSALRVRSGVEPMREEIRTTIGNREADAFVRFANWLRALYAVEMPNFIDRNYDSALDLARPMGPALALLRLGAFRRLQPQVASYFADDRLRRVFSFQSLYAGLAPYQALALYGVITYMDSVEGVFFPRGGVHEIAHALAGAIEKSGAELRFGDGVERIELLRPDGGPVCGVRMQSGDVIPAEVVVCNADIPFAYEQLLPGLEPPRRVRRAHFAPSAFVWHAGVRGVPAPEFAHHNIHFTEPWNDAFRALMRDGRRMPDPSILVTVATRTDPTLAPANSSTLFALEPVPNLTAGIDWRREAARARDDLARRVAALGYPDAVEVEAAYDPETWRTLGLSQGTPFAMSHRFRQSGPFRVANQDERAPGLFFVGAGTVPGVGVPMVLISGRLAAERVAEYVQ